MNSIVAIKFIKNTSLVSALHTLGMLSGFFKDAIILAYFGLSKTTDSFFVALAIPLLLISSFEIQVPKVLIPYVSNLYSTIGKNDSNRFVSNLINVSSLIFLLICCLLTIVSGFLIKIQVPGLSEAQILLSQQLFQILIWGIFFRSQSIILQSYILFKQQYLFPSAMKLVSNLTIALSIFILFSSLEIFSIAVGFFTGTILQLIILAIVAFKNGYRYKFVFHFSDKRLIKFSKFLLFPLLEDFLSNGKLLVENFVASFLSSGSLSILRYATRILRSISGVFLTSVVTTTIPTISEYVSQNNYPEMKNAISLAIKYLLFLSIPLSILLIFKGDLLFAIIFSRGQFSLSDSKLLNVLIVLMTPYMFLSRLSGVLQVPFFSVLKFKLHFYVTTISTVFYTIFLYFFYYQLGIYSFPICLSLSSLISCIILIVLFHHYFGLFDIRDLSKYIYKVTIIGFCCSIFFYLGQLISAKLFTYYHYNLYIDFLIPSILGFISFVTSAYFLLELKPYIFKKK